MATSEVPSLDSSSQLHIFRIEDTAGLGMYQKIVEENEYFSTSVWDKAVSASWCEFDNELRAHPPPMDDDLLAKSLDGRDMSAYKFAFRSAAQMRQWFYKDIWLQVLGSHGMRVTSYLVDAEQVLEADRQCLIPRGLEPIVSMPVCEFFGLKEIGYAPANQVPVSQAFSIGRSLGVTFDFAPSMPYPDARKA